MVRLHLLPVLAFQLVSCSTTGSPLAKVMSLLTDMEEKVKREGVERDESMKAKEVFCERRFAELSHSIKKNENSKEELEARISKADSKLQTVSDDVEEALSGIQSTQANLDEATQVRTKEKTEFETAQKDLMETMESIKRAVEALEKEATKGSSASLLQVQKAPDVLAAINVMVSGAMIGAADADGLTAFLQSADAADDLQPPVAPVYESKSGGIVDMLEDMQDKAKAELDELRKKEESARHSYAMVRQSLEDQATYAKEEVSKLKTQQAQLKTTKTGAQKDLEEASSDLVEDKKELDDTKMECRRKAEDYEAEKKSLEEELEALGSAKAALAGKTGGAEAQSYSFLQVASSATSGADQNVLTVLRDVARRTNSSGLALLSRRIRTIMRSDLTSTADAFGKIKNMISDMIESMEKQMQEAADKKAYCDAEMKKASTKQEGKESELEDLQTKIDAATSKSAALKEEVSDLQKSLATLAESEVNSTELRQKEKAQYKKLLPEVQEGLDGVKMALKVLREYYKGTQAATERGGTATGVIGQLEVVESDFAKNMAQMRVAEATAEEDFKKEMKDFELEKVRKEQDVKYKMQEAQRLDVDLQEFRSDSDSVQTELSAIEEFNTGLKAECSVTPVSFKERMAKRQQEIDGLKEALETLDAESGTGLMQLKTERRKLMRLRGRRAEDLSP
mmetsp:Transcript_65694/g.154582  ORF Transcript_65694/g.154582 Transcript_65694/m.154582 type:complete len:683 (-) Transcript_65694:30-2078(-)